MNLLKSLEEKINFTERRVMSNSPLNFTEEHVNAVVELSFDIQEIEKSDANYVKVNELAEILSRMILQCHHLVAVRRNEKQFSGQLKEAKERVQGVLQAPPI